MIRLQRFFRRFFDCVLVLLSSIWDFLNGVNFCCNLFMIGVDVMKIANVIVAYLDDWGRRLPRGSGCYFSCAFVRVKEIQG